MAKQTDAQRKAMFAKEGKAKLSPQQIIILSQTSNQNQKSKIDIDTNIDNPIDKFPKKEFKLWIVKEPDGHEKVKGSESIVRSQHYGQAVDDFIIDWNKKRRLNRTIGYPVVQGDEV